MCGLIGSASTEGMKNRGDRREVIEEGLAIDAFRGRDSTGIALIEKGKEKESPEIYKRDLNGFDFIQNIKVRNFLNDIEKYSIVMGHNRSATRGTITSANAHPFQFNNITLVHNGTVDNAHDLASVNEAGSVVDSAKVAYAMARENDPKGIIERCTGGFTFMWHDSKDGTLNVARNEKKPLFWCYIEKENTMYWASEESMLLHLLLRRGMNIEGDILYPKPGVWYKFKVDNLREFEKIPFALSQGRHMDRGKLTPWEGHTDQGWKQEVLRLREGRGTSTTPTTTNTERGASDEELDEIRRSLSHQRIRDFKRTGIPTSKKRIERASNELNKLGYRFQQNSVFLPEVWVCYKNQKDRGVAVGRLKDGASAQLYNIPEEIFEAYKAHGRAFVQLVNVRQGPKNLVSVICVEHPKHSEIIHREVQSQLEGSKSSSIERVLNGPGGTLISKARFTELTSNGCGNCTGFVNPIYHYQTLWVGNPPTPICHECSRDKEIMEGLGLTAPPEAAPAHLLH